jgi:transcriptional regulator with XRE-family HTH domain
MAKRRGDLLQRLGARLRALREERGLSQETVGERAGFTGKYVSEIERGLRDPPMTTVASIVENGLGASLDETLVGVGSRRAATPNDREPAMPRPVKQLARELCDVDPLSQRRVIEVVRGVLALAKGER